MASSYVDEWAGWGGGMNKSSGYLLLIIGAFLGILITLFLFNNSIFQLEELVGVFIISFFIFAIIASVIWGYRKEIIKYMFKIDLDDSKVSNIKALVIGYFTTKTWLSIVSFFFLFFGTIVGLFNIIVFQKQNIIIQKQLDAQVEMNYSLLKEKIFRHLYDVDKNRTKYNSRLRENSLDTYIKIEEKKENKNIDLSYARLENIKYNHKDLSDLNLNFTTFSRSELYYTSFSNSKLSYANFQDAILTEVNLKNSVLFYTNFYNAKMRNIKWDKNITTCYCNIYNADINETFKEYLLEKGCVEEANLSKWKNDKDKIYKMLRFKDDKRR